MSAIISNTPGAYPRHSRRIVAFAATALFGLVVGAGAGWSIGHQQRGAVRTASSVVAAAQQTNPPASGIGPVTNAVVAPDFAVPAKGGMAEQIDAARANAPSVPDIIAPAKGGMAEQIDAARDAALSLPVSPKLLYVYLVDSQQDVDAWTASLNRIATERDLGYQFVVRAAGSTDDQSQAYAEIQELSGMQGFTLNVVDMRGPASTPAGPAVTPGAE